MSPAKGPLEFRPMQGLMGLVDRAAAALGCDTVTDWHGADGWRAVIQDWFQSKGVPAGPVPISGPGAPTPRQLAEHAGFLARRHRRLKK